MPADRDAHVPLVRSVAPLLPDARGRHRGRPARPQPPPAPMPAGEIPVPLAELLAWAVHLLPAGFRGGMAAALFTPGGLHMGLLSLLSEDPSRPGPADREVIAAVTEVIAHGLDRTREIAATAQIVRAASTGVVLARSGHILPLPGLPGTALWPPAPGSSPRLRGSWPTATRTSPPRRRPATGSWCGSPR
jgi:hypothetical protein